MSYFFTELEIVFRIMVNDTKFWGLFFKELLSISSRNEECIAATGSKILVDDGI